MKLSAQKILYLRIALIALALIVIAPPTIVWAWMRIDPLPLPGLRVESIPISRGAWRKSVEARATDWLDTEISIDVGTMVTHATRRDLGGTIDLAKSLADVKERGRDASPLRDLRVLDESLHGSLDVKLARGIDRTKLVHYLDTLRDQFEIAPRSEELDSHARILPPRRGVVLDFTSALEKLERDVVHDSMYIALPVVWIDPPVADTRTLNRALFTKKVGEFVTHYSGTGETDGRIRNIERAAEELDGALIPPHATFSFNDRVGPRTEKRGFQEAPEIAGGRLSTGIGGGICQTAATFFAASFMGGLEIVEHHPHPRSSSYIALGLDSAVSYRNHDLRVRNPYPFFIRVRATAERGAMTITLLGAQKGPSVEWHAEIVDRTERSEEVVEDVDAAPRNAKGELDDGDDGMIVHLTRTVYTSEGPTADEWRLEYPAVSRLVQTNDP